MALNLITAPAAEPLSLAEARAQCRVDAGDASEDALIALYIQAARETAEHILGRVLITQTWELSLDAFPAGEIRLGKAQALSIVSVKYIDPNNILQTLSDAAYALDAATSPGWLLPVSGYTWPITKEVVNAVRVQFTAGYGATAASVPASVRQWMLVTVAALYAQRESFDLAGRAGVLPERFIDRLLDKEKVWG
jgi:uncharacterized phiE125 gp8 family phage protein